MIASRLHASKPFAAVGLLAVIAVAAFAQEGQADSAATPVPAQVVERTVRVAPEATATATVRCPQGFVATGGGVDMVEDASLMVTTDVLARDGRSWDARVESLEDEDGDAYTFTLRVMCVHAGLSPVISQASAKQRPRARNSARR